MITKIDNCKPNIYIYANSAQIWNRQKKKTNFKKW
jgi:hypothetical protein